MTTAEMCEAILRKVLEIANEGRQVTFEQDQGDNTFTIRDGHIHTHAGVPDGDWDTLIRETFSAFHGGPGLSWVAESGPALPLFQEPPDA